jgi:hypothetical protein
MPARGFAKLALVVPQAFVTIDGCVAPRFNAPLCAQALPIALSTPPTGDMEAPLLYGPAVIDAAYAYAKVKAAVVRACPAVLGNLCEPLRRRVQSG